MTHQSWYNKRMRHVRERGGRWLRRFGKRLQHTMTKKRLVYGALGAVVMLTIVQLAWPQDRLPLFTTVDSVNLSGQGRSSAIEMLRNAYKQHEIEIFLGSSNEAVVKTNLAKAGVAVDVDEMVAAVQYPWYLRLIPTSLFWAGLTVKTSEVTPNFEESFNQYVTDNVLPYCAEAPVNATLKATENNLEVVAAKSGGKCKSDNVFARLKEMKPTLKATTKVTVEREEIAPAVDDAAARTYAEVLKKRLSDGVKIAVNGQRVVIDAGRLYVWLDFAVNDSELQAIINSDRAAEWLHKEIAGKVAVAPGVSEITTRDLTVTARKDGAAGRALDVGQTVLSLQAVVDGKTTEATAVTKAVPPVEKYTRSYSASDTGLSALMENYAKDHPGEYGVSMIELDGKKRRADYNGNKRFVTASTYKLFTAYSVLKQIDEGKRDWGATAGCFNKMISQSDNACAESFLNSLGHKKATDDIRAIGLTGSTFMDSGGPYTTSNDQALLAGMIATGQNFSGSNQQRLISAMKANVHRQGIPSGVNGTVADKVGFMNGLLHDTAIVYGSSGTYVLSIMTDGSSWALIAGLARQLDALHAQ